MTNQKVWNDFCGALEILQGSLELFHDGSVSAYKTIAHQLHTLLCDGNPLLQTIHGVVRFHPAFSYSERPHGLQFTELSSGNLQNKKQKDTGMFDESQPTIELNEWLLQPIINGEITIQKLIQLLKPEEEETLSIPKNDSQLEKLKSIELDEPSYIRGIIFIGEYIYNQEKKALEESGFWKKEGPVRDRINGNYPMSWRKIFILITSVVIAVPAIFFILSFIGLINWPP